MIGSGEHYEDSARSLRKFKELKTWSDFSRTLRMVTHLKQISQVLVRLNNYSSTMLV